MTVDDVVRLIKSRDVRGHFENLSDDFIYSFRHEAGLGARYGSAILRLRRLARGHDVAVDETMAETAKKFANWLEAERR